MAGLMLLLARQTGCDSSSTSIGQSGSYASNSKREWNTSDVSTTTWQRAEWETLYANGWRGIRAKKVGKVL